MTDNSVEILLAKEAIRDLVLLYSRGINRKDFDLLQSLYTADATDNHGASYFPTADAFISRLRQVVPAQRCGGLFVCNHLITVDGDRGEGEVYALSYHQLPDGAGGWTEHRLRVRYLDEYRKEQGRWRFANRTMVVDHYTTHPAAAPSGPAAPEDDLSYSVLKSGLFRAGPRP